MVSRRSADGVVMLVLLFYVFWFGAGGEIRNPFLIVARFSIRSAWRPLEHGRSDDFRARVRRDAGGGPRRLFSCVFCFPADFSYRKHPCGIALDLEFHVGPVYIGKSCGNAAYSKVVAVARRLVESHAHRHHRLGFSTGLDVSMRRMQLKA